MKLINKNTGKVITEIVTNRSLSIDEVINMLDWKVEDDGEVLTKDGNPVEAYYEEMEMKY
mgnify:CR=1 FL=1